MANKRWSFNAGDRGRNWVRAYEDRPGKFYVEWFEPDDQHPGRRRRRRVLLRGVTDRRTAKERAKELADRFGAMGEAAAAPISIADLITLYLKEVTPNKGPSKQQHDRSAHRLWIAFFDSQPEAHRHGRRSPESLDRIDWDRFIAMRRAGEIEGWGPVGDRQVQYDLKFMISVLNWATGRKEGERPLLARNPWGTEIRRSQKWEMPRERNPHRPAMTDEIRAELIAHAPSWQFAAALELERETRRRNSAIRRLLWSDIDLDAETVRWRSEVDKAGRENVTPLTRRAAQILRGLPSRGIGDVPVFPSATDPMQPTSRHTFQTWLRRAKARWLRSITDEQERQRVAHALRGLGFHGEKRAGVRDPAFRRLSPKVQEEIAGTNYETLRTIYDQVSVEELRREMAEARAL